MWRYQHKVTKITKNQENMTLPKEQNSVLVTDPKEMEVYKVPDQEFKIIIINKLSEVPENTK